VRGKWLFVIVGPSLLLVAGSIAALLFLPHPVPKTATGPQRVYLTHCASCHGADGRGSWRATLFLVRPGNLADPAALGSLTDDYPFQVIKHGGGSFGKPGMPAFGFHLSDEQIRELVVYLRTFPQRERGRPGPVPGRRGAAVGIAEASGSR
jgi:mono/diheme cytochrome c family protein